MIGPSAFSLRTETNDHLDVQLIRSVGLQITQLVSQLAKMVSLSSRLKCVEGVALALALANPQKQLLMQLHSTINAQ